MKNLLEIGFLFDAYGNLLTEKQREIIELYYYYDLSLGEISEQLSISRQGVHDSIKKSEQLLRDYEEKLGFVKKIYKYQEIAKLSLQQIETIENELIAASKNQNSIVDNINNLKTSLKFLSEE
jgi:uncharacterized protein